MTGWGQKCGVVLRFCGLAVFRTLTVLGQSSGPMSVVLAPTPGRHGLGAESGSGAESGPVSARPQVRSGPPAGHPERLRPEVPLTSVEQAHAREMAAGTQAQAAWPW